MTTAYTSLLGLALPVTGELSGTWGDTVNDYITQYLDASVAGTQTISGSQTAVTLSKTTNASLSQAGSGATGSSQYNVINCTGNPASMLTVTVPAASKTYVVVNATSTNQDVKIVGAGPTTGVTLVAGERAIIAWNGSDFIKVATSTVDGVSTIAFGTTGLTPSAATSGAVTVAGTLVAANGGTGQSSYTTGDLLYATGSTALSKLGIGASGNYLSSSGTAPQWSAPAALTKTDDTNVTLTLGGSASTALLNAASLTLGWTGQLSVARGGTNATATPTAGAVAYGTGTAYAFTAAGTSNQVLISNGSSAPSWSNLSSLGVTSLSFGTTGLTPSTATQGAITVAGTLATTNGGTGLTAFTANRVFYASSTSAIGSSANLTFDGTTLTANTLSLTNALGVTSGGTGTSTAFTAGSVVFAGTSGVYSQNNSQLFWDNTNARLGIGTSSPASKLHIDTVAAGYGLTLAASSLTARTFQFGLDSSANLAVYDTAAAAVRITLTGAGNLGLGVTPSAWISAYRAIDIGNHASVYGRSDTTVEAALTANTFRNSGGNWIYKTTNVAGRYGFDSVGSWVWFQAASGTAGNTVSWTQSMTLNASGDLGIGTTSPGSRLHVNGTSGAAGSIGITVTNTTTTGSSTVQFGDGTNTTGQIWSGNSSYASFGGAGSLNYSANSGPHAWHINYTERMRLDSSGNLGIGTSSPSVKLDVQGGSINTSSFVTITPTTTTLNAIYRATNTGGTFYAGLDNSAGGVTGTAYAAMIWHTGAYPISFGTNNTLRATIDSSGNLGIGTSSPTNILSLGGNSARTIWMERHTTANTAGNNLTLQSGGATSGATDKNGGTLILSSGTATGSGSSLITFLTAVAGAAGTADRAPAERGRFDASGNFLVGTTTNTNTSSIVANGTISETVGGVQYLVASQADIGTAANEIPLNQYLGALAYVDTETPALAVGSGITGGTGTICKVNGGLSGGIYRVTILIDLTGLNSGGTANDIIGVNGTANPCFIALLPAITVLGGRMTCLETPAGGDTDIDLYSAVEGTGVEDQAITALTETLIINAGAQTTGTVTYFSADPGANTYLYLCGQGTANATYTAGRFLIEIFGVQ